MHEREIEYPPEVIDAIKSIAQSESTLRDVQIVENKGRKAFVKKVDPSSEPVLEVDETIKKVWRGFAYGKVRELKADGYANVIKEIFKTFDLLWQ